MHTTPALPPFIPSMNEFDPKKHTFMPFELAIEKSKDERFIIWLRWIFAYCKKTKMTLEQLREIHNIEPKVGHSGWADDNIFWNELNFLMNSEFDEEKSREFGRLVVK